MAIDVCNGCLSTSKTELIGLATTQGWFQELRTLSRNYFLGVAREYCSPILCIDIQLFSLWPEMVNELSQHAGWYWPMALGHFRLEESMHRRGRLKGQLVRFDDTWSTVTFKSYECCALLSYHAYISFERRSGFWLHQLHPLCSPHISRFRYPFHAGDRLIGPWIWMLEPIKFSHGPIYVTRFPSTLLYSLQVNFPFVEPEVRGGLYIYLEKNLLVANVKDAYPVLVVFKAVNTSFMESAIITKHSFWFQLTHVISCCFQGNRFIELSQAYEGIVHLAHCLGAQSKG